MNSLFCLGSPKRKIREEGCISSFCNCLMPGPPSIRSKDPRGILGSYVSCPEKLQQFQRLRPEIESACMYFMSQSSLRAPWGLTPLPLNPSMQLFCLRGPQMAQRLLGRQMARTQPFPRNALDRVSRSEHLLSPGMLQLSTQANIDLKPSLPCPVSPREKHLVLGLKA